MTDRDCFPCPACGAPLFAGRAPDTTLLACKRCAGIWLDNAASQLAAKARLSEFALSIARLLDQRAPGVRARPGSPYRAPPGTSPPAFRACPICAAPLVRRFVAHSSTELDICEAHGTWFDRRELWAVVSAVAMKQGDEDAEAVGAARAAQGIADSIVDALLRS